MSEVKKKEFTLDEVKKHTTAEDCWLIIGNQSNGAFCADAFLQRKK